MISRREDLDQLFECFQVIKKNIVLPQDVRGSSRVTPSQWMVLRMVDQHEGMTVKKVAAGLGITSSAATQLIDGLVRGGYVIRKENTKDRREVVLSLSRKAATEMVRLRRRAYARLEKVFEVLNDEELSALLKLNTKIIRNLP